MPTSRFWRKLSAQFRALDPLENDPESEGSLQVLFLRLQNDTEFSYQLASVGDDTVATQFEAMASRVGRHIPQNPDLSAHDTWLEAIVKIANTQEIRFMPSGDEANPWVWGKVIRACEASANHCNRMESSELEFDFRRKRDAVGLAKAAKRTAKSKTVREGEPKDAKPAASLRRLEIDDFLAKCNEISYSRIYRKHIWRSVGHSTSRQFEYWQAGSPKATDEDERNFKRVIRTNPVDFISLLRQQDSKK